MLPEWIPDNVEHDQSQPSEATPVTETNSDPELGANIYSNQLSQVCPVADNLADVCLKKFARQLQLAIGPQRYNKWFADTTTAVLNGDLLIVGLNSPFLLNWMEQQFQAVAENIAELLLGPSAQVRFEVTAAAHREFPGISFMRISDHPTHDQPAAVKTWTPTAPHANGSTPTTPAANGSTVNVPAANVYHPENIVATKGNSVSAPQNQPTTLPELRPDQRELPRQKLLARRRRFARLQDYISGASNHVALKMAELIATHPGEEYNPFYLYGHVGNGKTHLLEGIHAEIREHFPEMTVMYLTAESFANYYTKALREKTLAAFRRRFRSVDVLLVDDIDFFDAKRGLQEEFCHTIQDLLAYGRQVVLAADRHPRMLTNIRPELGTRFQAGLVTRIETPDETTRREIIRHQVGKLAIPVSDDAIDYMAQKFSRNVRELMGAIHCLQTYYYLKKRPLGITATREVLRDLERDCLRIIRTADIQNAVCEVFGITQQELISPRRTRKLVQPRMIAMYLSRKLTSDAYCEIGKQFGGRNHSTVITAERKVEELLQRNSPILVATREWKAQEVLSLLQERLQVN